MVRRTKQILELKKYSEWGLKKCSRDQVCHIDLIKLKTESLNLKMSHLKLSSHRRKGSEKKWRKPMWIMGLHPVTNIFSVDIPREEREKGQETYFKKFPGGRFKGEGTYVYLWLDHVDVWLRPTQYCKAIILQLKIDWRKEILKSRTRSWTSVSMNLLSPCIDVTQRRFFEDTL